jgi:DNA-binding IclR family transcriptional regulator
LTLRAIANGAGTSLASAHRLVITLQSLEVVKKDLNGHYLLGPKLIEIGDHARRLAAPQSILTDLVARVAHSMNETAHIAVLHGDMARYVAKGETARGLRTVTQVGKELEAYCTGVGKVLLAFCSARTRNRYLRAGEFIKLTSNTISNRNQLRKELSKIRSAGFAVDSEEFEEGLKCIAVPIHSQTGRVVASLSISGPSSRLDRVSRSDVVRQLQQYSRLITSRIQDSDWKYV